jgi:hypothetical protein
MISTVSAADMSVTAEKVRECLLSGQQKGLD